jgi:hypothetical protein
MGTKIVLEFSSATVYSEEEVKALAVAFADFMNVFDDDADPSTIIAKAIDPNTVEKLYSSEEIGKAIREGVIDVKITFAPEDEITPFSVRLNNDESF